MEQSASFRSAAIGGFQRQDVLDYLKKNAEEHHAQLEALKQSLQKAEERIGELDRTAEEARKEAAQLREQAQSAEGKIQSLEGELEQARSQLEHYAQMKSDYAEIEIDARRRAARLVEQAQARAATIQAEAHTAADALLDNAQREAETQRLRMRQDQAAWEEQKQELMNATRTAYQNCAMELKSGISAALMEVNQLRVLLTNLEDDFDQQALLLDRFCEEEA